MRSAAAGDNGVDQAVLAVIPRWWVLFILLANGRPLANVRAHLQAQTPGGIGQHRDEQNRTRDKPLAVARPFNVMYFVVAAPVGSLQR